MKGDRNFVRFVLGLLVVAALGASSAAQARTIDFPYRDGQLLRGGQHNGGRIWLPNSAGPGKTYTLVVLLHGLNARGEMQPLLGHGRVDIAAVATQLIRQGAVRQDFILAAPTQTRNAEQSNTLWVHFDLKDFIKAVQRKLPKGIRLAGRPVVMGHSGAGCTPNAGLWWLARQHGGWIRALATMDTCMTRAFGQDLYRYLYPQAGDKDARGPRGGQTWLINFWQSGWSRDINGYEEALHFSLLDQSGPRGLRNLKRNPRRWLSAQVNKPHDKLVESIFDEALRRLFPTPSQLQLLERQLTEAQRDRDRAQAKIKRDKEQAAAKVKREAARAKRAKEQAAVQAKRAKAQAALRAKAPRGKAQVAAKGQTPRTPAPSRPPSAQVQPRPPATQPQPQAPPGPQPQPPASPPPSAALPTPPS